MSFIELLFYRIYRLPYITVFLLILGAVLLWAILSVTLGKKYPKSWKAVNAALLVILLLAILYYTLLRRTPEAEKQLALKPFASLEAARLVDEIYRSLTMNILLFFPIGLFLPQLLPGKWKPWQKMLVTVAAGLVFSAGIETIQYLYKLGDAETDDTITNVIGTALGSVHILFAAGISRFVKKKKAE